MPRMSSLVSVANATSARKVLRKARTAARLAKEDPAKLARRIRQRARRHTRRVSPTVRRSERQAPPITMAASLPVAAERGYVVIERRRGFEQKDYAITAALQDQEGHSLKPGREWKYSHSLGGYYVYPDAAEPTTVTLSFTAPGEGATRVELTLRRWNSGARPPAETFGPAWVVFAQSRQAGADPHRLGLVPLEAS